MGVGICVSRLILGTLVVSQLADGHEDGRALDQGAYTDKRGADPPRFKGTYTKYVLIGSNLLLMTDF